MDGHYVMAGWNEKAQVWVSSSNVPGLVVEAETLAEFFDLADAFIPELLAASIAPPR